VTTVPSSGPRLQAGCTFKFWVADWFAQLNNKMGGDLKKIQTVGKYMVEVSMRVSVVI
jgi:tyrosyl-tRNA synthetase